MRANMYDHDPVLFIILFIKARMERPENGVLFVFVLQLNLE